jgi:Carboxypeptidase regulatory-like domain
MSRFHGVGDLSRRLLVCIVCFFSLSLTLHAQTNTASISGIVKDPSGATIGGANDVVENTATGVQHQVQTNSEGVFSVFQLRPGSSWFCHYHGLRSQ